MPLLCKYVMPVTTSYDWNLRDESTCNTCRIQGHIRYQLYLSLNAPPGNDACSQKDNIASPEKASEPIRDWECRSGEIVDTRR
jgi:hypothetical protein